MPGHERVSFPRARGMARTVAGPRRPWIPALAVMVGLVLSGIAAASMKGTVTVIGDSVADRMERNPAAIAALNEQFHLDLETRVCRRLVSPSCASRGAGGPPPTVLQLVRTLSQNIGRVVVVDVGYNDWSRRYSHDIDTVMRALQRLRVKTVVWLTLRDPHHAYRLSNLAIRSKPREWPDFVVADWDRYSQGHRNWFEADGLHLTTRGATRLAQFIRSVLARHA
jgi:hypothetical protein